MNASDLLRKPVFDSNARKIGRVSDIILDLPPGVVTHIVVRLGFTKKYTVSVNKIEKVGDSVILGATAAELEKK